MAVIEEWPKDIKHEIKSPLCIIIQNINYIERGLDKEKQSELLNLMKEAVMKADKIVRDLIDFSKPTQLKLKPCEINKIIDSSLELLGKQIPFKNIKITKNFAIDSPLVMIDENQIKQVFINIILDFLGGMSNGGELTIRTYTKKATELKDGIERKAADFFRPLDMALISEIKSVPEGKLSRVFEPLCTTKPSGQGVDLTIITKSIVNRHMGLINIESKEGQGTKVIITLPIAKRER